MIRTVAILLTHDLAVAWKSKTLFLIVGIPLFVYSALALVDPAESRVAGATIALISTEAYPPGVREGLERSPGPLTIRWAPTEMDALGWLKAREVSGMLSPAGGDTSRLLLTVVQEASVETLTILQRVSALQVEAEGARPGWIGGVRSLETSSVQRQTLPTWILMMVLLVSFIVLPAQVAEEKEKQLLLGWMQAPVREGEWLAAKLAYAIVLMLASVALLHGIGREPAGARVAGYLVTLGGGGFCFAALGICLGLLCRSQASARVLGVLCYLPLLLPSALSDQSPTLRSVASLVPSYPFYAPLRALLLEEGGARAWWGAWLILAGIGAVAVAASHRLIRKRWLM